MVRSLIKTRAGTYNGSTHTWTTLAVADGGNNSTTIGVAYAYDEYPHVDISGSDPNILSPGIDINADGIPGGWDPVPVAVGSLIKIDLWQFQDAADGDAETTEPWFQRPTMAIDGSYCPGV